MKFIRNYYLEELPQTLLLIFLLITGFRSYFIVILIILSCLLKYSFFEIRENVFLEKEKIIIIKNFLFKREEYSFYYKNLELLTIDSQNKSIDDFLGFSYYFLLNVKSEKIKIFRKFLGNDKIFFKKIMVEKFFEEIKNKKNNSI